MTHGSSSWSHISTFLHFQFLLILLTYILTITYSHEITATKEWQILKEGETIPSGLHVQMNLTSGITMVKQIEEEEPSAAHLSISSINDFDKKVLINYDVPSKDLNDVIVQQYHILTSVSLESDSWKDMLPMLPNVNATEQQHQIFEQEVTHIWNSRQEQLRQWQEEHVADIPTFIKEQIEALESYIQSQQTCGKDLSEHMEVTQLRKILQELEGHVQDIDFARDFRQMGGWRLLLSLLFESTHGQNSLRENHEPTSSKNSFTQLHEREHIWKLQGMTAWVIGTSVKHIEEFQYWSLEEIEDPRLASATNPLRVLIQLIDTVTSDLRELSKSESLSSSLHDSLHYKAKKTLYALSSIIRGNPTARQEFGRSEGPLIIFQFLHLLVQSISEEPLPMSYAPTIDIERNPTRSDSPLAMACVIKVVQFVHDILLDLTLMDKSIDLINVGVLQSESDAKIRQSLTTQQWCDVPFRLLSFFPRHVTTRNTSYPESIVAYMLQLMVYCHFTQEQMHLLTAWYLEFTHSEEEEGIYEEMNAGMEVILDSYTNS